MPKRAIPVRDKVTGKIYPTESGAARELGPTLVPEVPQNNWTWYPMHRAHPDRFQRLVNGKWVDYPPLGIPNGNVSEPHAAELKKFSVTYRVAKASDSVYYLIEAADRAGAERTLSEELGPNRPEFEESITWSTHETPEWRAAWRHGTVRVLRPTKIPEGIE